MIMIHLLSRDVKDSYESGKRVFENADLEYAEMENWTLDDIAFKNCKFNFTSFYLTSLKNAKFINCSFFFHSFFGANMEGVLFENCKIEGVRMDTARFDRTVFRKCDLSYIFMINTNRGGVDFFNSSMFGMVFSHSDITDDLVRGALNFFMPHLDSLDMEIKSHLKSVIKRYADELGVNTPNTETTHDTYQKSSRPYNKDKAAYGAVSGIFDEIINAYANMNKSKKDAYDKKDSY